MLKLKILIFCIFSFWGIAQGQLIDSTQNHILNAENLLSFSQKLAELKDGKGAVSILHIGDSHIQAGFFTETLREAFQRDYGDAGRGLVFPYRLANTNGNSDARFVSNVEWQRYRIITDDAPKVGIAGATVYTNADEFTVQLRCDEDKKFNQIEILGEGLDQVKLAIPKVKGQKLQPQISKKIHRVKRGDVLGKIARKYKVSVSSIKKWNGLRGSMVRIGQKLVIRKRSKTPIFNPNEFCFLQIYEHSPTSIKAVWDTDIDEIYFIKEKQPNNKTVKLYGVHLGNRQQGITYDAVGFNGAKYTDYLRSDLFFEQLEQFSPQLVIISLGTNEAFDKHYQLEQFREDVERFCEQVEKRTGCNTILLTTPPSSLRKRRYINKKLPLYAQILKEVANEKNYAVWDLYEIMGGANGMKTWAKKGLAGKLRIHFTESGYQLQGEALYKALTSIEK